MAKQDKVSTVSKSSPQRRLMVRVEYVGIIAIACLIVGAIIGSRMSGSSNKIMVDTTAQSQMGSMNTPSAEEVKQKIGSISDYDALVHMGNAAMDQGNSTVAVAAYEKALTIHPDNPNVLTDLGAVYQDQLGQSQKALELFQKAAKLDPKHVQSRFNLGVTYLALKDDANARKAFSDVISIAPDSEQAKEAKAHLDKMK